MWKRDGKADMLIGDRLKMGPLKFLSCVIRQGKMYLLADCDL